MNGLISAVLNLGGIAIGATVWGTLIERQLFAVRRDSARVLPAGSKPITVLHVSDIHMAPWQGRKQRWLVRTIGKLAAAGEVDLVVNTGDNVGHERGIRPVLASLAPAMKLPGVFVNGSNDYYSPVLRNPFAYLAGPSKRGHGKPLATKEMTDAFERSGWLNLNNRGAVAEVGGLRIGFIGVDDAHDGLAKIDSLSVQAKANANSAKARIDLTIGVTHAPYLSVVHAMADAGASIVFAGHTHGGQVAIPGFGALVTNCDLPRQFAKGLSAWSSERGNTTILNVCAGLGHSIFAPVRFAVRPELRLLTLLPIEG
jgi:predicted MPP superfamily phosphohydrolase